jgi:hypothetical protein
VLFKRIKKCSPPFRATTIHIQNEKAKLTSILKIDLTNIRKVFFVNMQNDIVKIIFQSTAPMKWGL